MELFLVTATLIDTSTVKKQQWRHKHSKKLPAWARQLDATRGSTHAQPVDHHCSVFDVILLTHLTRNENTTNVHTVRINKRVTQIPQAASPTVPRTLRILQHITVYMVFGWQTNVVSVGTRLRKIVIHESQISPKELQQSWVNPLAN